MTERAEEYQFFKKIGICTRCHKRGAEPNKVLCLECADADNMRRKIRRKKNAEQERKTDMEKYERLKINGICTYCKRRSATTGKTKCEICLAKIRNRRNSRNTDIKRSERVSYGLCYICGKNELHEDKKVCKSCYDKRLASVSKIMYMPVSKAWRKDNNMVYK